MLFSVNYDLNKEVKRPNIVAEIRKTDYARLSESSYIIDTLETADQVYARFKKHLDSNDHFFVLRVTKPYTGWGPKDVVDWLDSKMQYQRAA
ncbi:MAG: hypothetical protein JNK47_16850 [Mesorhizobium sp.]|nr:hypothetical protein [Mesorhizobium sp.]MBL8578894.1 hypothetical protein [Mesorhizobium sp.]